MTSRKKPEDYFIALISLALIISHFLIFSRFLPNNNGNMGHDYSYYFPLLLDGYIWFKNNGLFAVYWFTPSFCGGIPRFPNPLSIYYSVPQVLGFFMDPMASVKLTLFIFSTVGFSGFYFLLRSLFRLSRSACLVGATLFLFNGFYAHKFIIGHLSYHAFMLIPWITYFIVRPGDRQKKTYSSTLGLDLFCASILLLYLLMTDIAYLAAPTLLIIIVTALVYGINNTQLFSLKQFAIKFFLSGILALGLFSFKLTAALSFLGNFPRDLYSLPGIESPVNIVLLVFKSLFITPQHEFAEQVFVNKAWALERHEFEFGLSVIPLILIGLYLLSKLRPYSNRFITSLHRTQWLYLLVILVLLMFPLVINYYAPAWNDFLKQIPLFKSSSSLVRWFCVYIPVTCLLSVLALENTHFLKGPRAIPMTAFCILLLLYFNINADRQYYHKQDYNPNEILRAYHAIRTDKLIPTIDGIGVYQNETGDVISPLNRNNSLIYGKSQFLCYEPLFGYRLENFPFGSLHPGAVIDADGKFFNMKNPACYVFPAENSCKPGDHFSLNQARQLENFVRYRPFDFTIPWYQKLANLISGLTLAIIILLAISNLLQNYNRKNAPSETSS